VSDTVKTEFETAWEEGQAEDRGQPTGRPDPADHIPDPEPAGADAAAIEPAADAQPPAAEEPAGGDEISDELWNGADPRLRTAWEAAQAKLQAEQERAAKAENTLRSNQGRLSRADRELNELRHRLQQQPKEEPKASEEAGVDIDAALSKVAEEYPDIGGPLQEVIGSFRSKVERLEQAEASAAEREQALADLRYQESLAEQAQMLGEKHPDWSEVVSTQAYADWALAQPGFVQDLIRKNGTALVDGEAAVEVFDRFKRDTQTNVGPDPHQTKRDRQLEGSRHVHARTPALTATDKGGGDFESEWKRAAEEERRTARS
jgi:hypothetical protein